MKRYKEPSFQERIANATRAKADALVRLRTKPPVDEAAAAERSAKRLAKEAAVTEKRRVAKLASDENKAAKRAKAAEAVASTAPLTSDLTDADRKARRDARYLARKSRAAS